MLNKLLCSAVLLLSALSLQAEETTTDTVTAKNPTAIMHTSLGDITLELYPTEAPITVANFISYIESGFYNGTIFHRVMPRFVVQGGGFTKEMQKKTTNAPITNESRNGLFNERWTLSMARTQDPHSATSQFFINLQMNRNLDPSGRGPGYAVFAKVIDGQHVVAEMAKQPTGNKGHYQNVPIEPIIIQSVEMQP